MKQQHLITALIILTMAVTAGSAPSPEIAITGKASYYTEWSCKREGTSGIWTASGARFSDSSMTCALPKAIAKSMNIKYGAKVRVTNLDTGATVTLVYNDRGPAAWTGCVIDLTQRAFEELGGKLKDGKINVKVMAI